MANVGERSWSSGMGFVLAAAGAAVGLGNLWRFPFLAGENGGGAFVLIYIGCVLVIGLPIMLAELVLGREGGGSALLTMRRLTENGKAHSAWRAVGFLSVLIPFVGIGYYSVAGGWVVDFSFSAVLGEAGSPSGEAASSRFNDMLGDPVRLLTAHSVFMLGVILVLVRGVQGGIEKLSKILMPALFTLLIGLVLYAALNADMAAATKFLFQPDFSKVTGQTVVMAAGQAFFSLAIGVGIMITYGSYVPGGVSLVRSVGIICVMDTLVALLAGLVIFPFVFAEGLDPSSGPGLMFVTLPTAFGQMAGGAVVGGLFFMLLFFAAFTTGIGTMEPVVAWAEEKQGMTRKKATVVVGFLAWLVGILALLSFNVWQDVRPLGFLLAFADKGVFDSLDFVIASVLLPLNGLLIALFTGWVICKKVNGTLGLPPVVEQLWGWSLRIVVPVAILLIAFSN